VGIPIRVLRFVYIPIIPLLVADYAITNVERKSLKQLDLCFRKRTVLVLVES